MVGKRWAKRSRPVASSQRWSTPCSAIRAAMARLTTSRGASSSTKRSPSRVAQQRAVAAQGLGEQRPGHGRVVQRRRVELHELDVGRGHARPAAPWPRRRRSTRRGLVVTEKSWPAPPVASTTCVGPHIATGAGRAPGGGSARHADAAPALDEQVEGEPALEHGAGRLEGGVDQGPLDLGSGGGAAGVHHPGPRVAALAGQGEGAGGLAVELARRARSARAPGPGPRRPGSRTASSSHRPAPAASVSARCRSVESSSPPSTAATPPWAQRVADWDSAPLVSTPSEPTAAARRGPARRTAAESPATPLPRTRTSKGPGRASGAHAGSVRGAQLGVEAGRRPRR